jgi:hypothetical protein
LGPLALYAWPFLGWPSLCLSSPIWQLTDIPGCPPCQLSSQFHQQSTIQSSNPTNMHCHFVISCITLGCWLCHHKYSAMCQALLLGTPWYIALLRTDRKTPPPAVPGLLCV